MTTEFAGLGLPVGVVLRLSTRDDAVALTDVEQAAMVDQLEHIFPQQHYPFPRNVILDRWSGEVTDPSYRIVVAQRGDDVVGYCACQGDKLWHIGVMPSEMGNGLARALLTEARRAHPHTALWLWVLEENHRARRFYEREGWTLQPETMVMPFPPDPVAVKYQAPPLGQ